MRTHAPVGSILFLSDLKIRDLTAFSSQGNQETIYRNRSGMLVDTLEQSFVYLRSELRKDLFLTERVQCALQTIGKFVCQENTKTRWKNVLRVKPLCL